MKRILIATLALAAVFVSCQKAAEMKESAEVSEGRLEVTGRVADGITKTAFSCDEHVLTPEWKVGDRIIGLWGEDKSVTYRVKSVDGGGAAKFKLVSGAEPLDGEKVYVLYAPGKTVKDVTGTGDDRKLAYDLSNQVGTLEFLGDVALMSGSGIVSGERLELIFSHSVAVIAIDSLKGLAPNADGYSVSIKGAGLANGGTFGISGDAIAFTGGTDGRISTGATFAADAEGRVGPVFFAVPAATLEGLTVSVIKEAKAAYGVLSGKIISAGNYYYRDTLTVFVPPTVLRGAFSIGSDKKVYFSRGNLYYNGSLYDFEATQYDYPTSWDPSHVGHFYWSKDETVARAENYSESAVNEEQRIFTNGFTMELQPNYTMKITEFPKEDFTVCGETGKFRTLNLEEWKYLLYTRPNAANLQVVPVTVCGATNCALIAPDETLNGYVFDKAKVEYNASEWAEAEAAGVICLPAAGRRGGSLLVSGGEKIEYWQSRPFNPETAYTVRWWNGCGENVVASEQEMTSRSVGLPVRLVSESAE